MNTKKRLICIGACGIGVIVLVVAVLLVQLLPKKGDTDSEHSWNALIFGTIYLIFILFRGQRLIRHFQWKII
mgnify:CR=1 FL=1